MFITLTLITSRTEKAMRVNINHIVTYVKFDTNNFTQLVTSEMESDNYSAIKETPEQIDMLIKQAMEA